MRTCSSVSKVMALLSFLGASAITNVVFAQQPFDVGSPSPAAPAPGGTEQAVIPRYWELGRPRLFLATTIEVGYAYARPRFALGYGQPNWRWIGLEAYPLVSLASVGQYVGIGGAIPGLTFRSGARYTFPFSRYYLVQRAHYDRVDLEREDAPRASYAALEAEVTGTVPLFAGSAFAVLTGYRTALTEENYYLYEETLRTVMAPPYIWRARVGYLLAFGRDGAIRVGGAAEVIGMPGREEWVLRAGLLGSVLINAHLEAQASFIPVIAGPDRTGLAGGDFGQLGVRFRWGTGSNPDPARVREVLEEKEREHQLKTR